MVINRLLSIIVRFRFDAEEATQMTNEVGGVNLRSLFATDLLVQVLSP